MSGRTQKICESPPRRVHISHLLGLLLLLLLIIVIVFLVFLVIRNLLAVIFLFFLGFLHLTQFLPLLGENISLCGVISDDHVVENRSSLDLPQVKTDKTEVIEFVHLVIVLILRVGDLLRLPDPFVCWVRDPLAVPIALVGNIVFHWRLPFSILFIVPIVWLLSFSVHNAFLLHPIVWFLVLWVINHGVIRPIFRFFISRIRDFLCFQNLPVVFDPM